MKYVILGFPNSGSHSLEAYLKAQGHDVVRAEDSYRNIAKWKKNWPDRKPIFITRKDNHHLQRMDQEAKLKKWQAVNPEVVTLETMKLKYDFPKLNVSKVGHN